MSSPAVQSRRPVEILTKDLFDRLTEQAAASSRLRTNYNFHALSDSFQRMLNVVEPGSYIRPHRHRNPPKGESFIVLRGAIAFFTFGDDGRISEAAVLKPGSEAVGVDIEPGIWHCFAALEHGTVVFEAKNGPYDPATDKEFPAWAPAEGSKDAPSYLQRLLEVVRSES